MKTLIRNIFVATVLSPLIAYVYLRSLSDGRKKVVALVGPSLTRAAKHSLRYWVPALDRPEDFDRFAPSMKSRFWIWKLLYDFVVIEETRDIFKLRISNCPFCEVLKAMGLPELGPYVCEGDWAKAGENSDKWTFDRQHQIGTGDSFCDHTYMRKRSSSKAGPHLSRKA